jgi:hypothetical protein
MILFPLPSEIGAAPWSGSWNKDAIGQSHSQLTINII